MTSVPYPRLVSQPHQGFAGSAVTVVASPGEAHTRVHVAGEIDLDSAGHLRVALMRALSAAPAGTGLVLDMSAVTFCDSSGLNALLRLRQQAIEDGRSLTISHTGPQVARLLEMTGSAALFAA
ncbi:STAS domain-containing protein [Streptomyces sp. NPDC085614]|uniref:STAS domain-containing protein n=1 Tax=Streptomyces sp. NPDC085614 TaxID=3365733 RepID=UPI0037D09DB2